MQFYVINILYSLISLSIYCGFRSGITSNLRYRGCSKSYIKKARKGIKNYWFYTRVHAERDLSFAYRLNICLIVLTPMYFVFSVFFGWISCMRFPVSILCAVLCAVQIPSMVYAEIYYNLENYGEALVLYRRRKSFGGYDSSILDLTAILCIGAFAVYNFALI